MDARASGSNLTRRAGVLAHVSSLPGPAHCGNFGHATSFFLDWCSASGLRLWQVLPLGFPGPGHSPYASMSAFACNPSWYAHRNSRERIENDPLDRCDLLRASRDRLRWLEEEWRRFTRNAGTAERREYEAYRESDEQRGWLDDWTLFAALKERYVGRPWFEWDTELRRREPGAVRTASNECAERCDFHAWVQFELDRQARLVRADAERHDILWLGDLPFGVALDSADVWSRRELFRVDRDGRPAAVAGVPPDGFAPEGQCWNTPLFNWKALARESYRWWIARCRATLRWTHALRLDHFRGYSATWEIPHESDSAADGTWVEGPGDALFRSAAEAGLAQQLIAEDLGEITDDVHARRERFDYPGMHVLQFGLDDPESPHHPDRHRRHALACTGTHDNDTFNGWFQGLEPERRERVGATLGSATAPARAAVEMCWASPADWAVAPLQDLLELGSRARMNQPGRAEDQWSWRCEPGLLDAERSAWLMQLARRHGRV